MQSYSGIRRRPCERVAGRDGRGDAVVGPGVEDALYESQVLRRFERIDVSRAPLQGETTILNFRHLLEAHDMCGQILDTVNGYLGS